MPTHLCPQCGFDMVHIPTQGNRARLRARLSDLDSLIAALTAERDALQAQSDAIVYPVLSLPGEITSEIFQSCVDASSELDGGMQRRVVVPEPSQAPLILLQICRQWRGIAVSAPRLWRSLCVMDIVPAAVIHAWLTRAGNLPLHYRLHHSGSGGAPDSLVTDSILYASRWEDVGFRIPLALVPEFNLGHQLFPHLRKFALDAYPPFRSTTIPTASESLAIGLADAPLLREVHLSHIPPAVQLDITWAQLTHLKLHGMDIARCLSIISGCSQLQHLDAATKGTPVPQPLLTLPLLQSLSSTVSQNSILQYLILPRLEKLELHWGGDAPQQYSEVLEALSRRSNFPLKDFAVHSGLTTLELFQSCLHAVPPSVTRLALTWGGSIDMNDMLMLLKTEHLFPRLKQLVMHHNGLVSGDRYQAFVDFLHARAPVLELVDILLIPSRMTGSGWSMPDKLVMDQLQTLSAGGMNIRVKARVPGMQQTHVVYDSI
ncbi:hypothetical protein FB45DRAFT_48263 [Roridomyces roridus]|uniref:F-box domain-containing protein n=1 Tax=Roridomyces roridus TaxID=1738132 RepID=A0AAD7BT79_9AGAR|nr:hypothetical protein FB45DRAFT_48263 [Roridomyces roridus]